MFVRNETILTLPLDKSSVLRFELPIPKIEASSGLLLFLNHFVKSTVMVSERKDVEGCLSTIQSTVTILTSFEKCNNPYDWNDFNSIIMFMYWISQFKDCNQDSLYFAKVSLPSILVSSLVDGILVPLFVNMDKLEVLVPRNIPCYKNHNNELPSM